MSSNPRIQNLKGISIYQDTKFQRDPFDENNRYVVYNIQEDGLSQTTKSVNQRQFQFNFEQNFPQSVKVPKKIIFKNRNVNKHTTTDQELKEIEQYKEYLRQDKENTKQLSGQNKKAHFQSSQDFQRKPQNQLEIQQKPISYQNKSQFQAQNQNNLRQRVNSNPDDQRENQSEQNEKRQVYFTESNQENQENSFRGGQIALPIQFKSKQQRPYSSLQKKSDFLEQNEYLNPSQRKFSPKKQNYLQLVYGENKMTEFGKQEFQKRIQSAQNLQRSQVIQRKIITQKLNENRTRLQQQLKDQLYFDEQTQNKPKSIIKNEIIDSLVHHTEVISQNPQLLQNIIKLKQIGALKPPNVLEQRFKGVGKFNFIDSGYHSRGCKNGYSRKNQGTFFNH